MSTKTAATISMFVDSAIEAAHRGEWNGALDASRAALRAAIDSGDYDTKRECYDLHACVGRRQLGAKWRPYWGAES